jgi:hypothetical protein
MGQWDTVIGYELFDDLAGICDNGQNDHGKIQNITSSACHLAKYYRPEYKKKNRESSNVKIGYSHIISS